MRETLHSKSGIYGPLSKKFRCGRRDELSKDTARIAGKFGCRWLANADGRPSQSSLGACQRRLLVKSGVCRSVFREL